MDHADSQWVISRPMGAVLYALGVSVPGFTLLTSLHLGWPEPWSPLMFCGPLLSALAIVRSPFSRRRQIAWLLVIPIATVALFVLAFLIASWMGPQGEAMLDWRSVV